MKAGRRSRAWLLAPVAIVTITLLAAPGARAADPVPGSQGTNTALPATDSALTVNGRGAFADLAITVNQTSKLMNQAVSMTWTGGAPTRSGPGRFGSRYLQIMQCWGDDDGSVAGNPGPPPEQCVQGAVAGTYGGLPVGVYPAGFALSRVISRSDWANFDPAVGYLDTRTTNVSLPFRAVDGTVVNLQTDPTFNPAIVGGNFWLNPYFNIITTNEVAGSVTGPDGRGAELFQVNTGVQSSGLGCGQKTRPVPGGDKKVPRCWIVVVPRGAPADENAGTPFEVEGDQVGVVTSPLSPAVWQNRIAIPIDFNPVDSPCSLAADDRRISGSELPLRAVVSWQPALCASGDLPPFAFGTVGDDAARQQLLSNQPGSPGMVAVSKPLSPTTTDAARPIVYAPLSLSGLAIGFNIERNPRSTAPIAEQQLAGVRVAELNLTPRLVAKLLTQSYRQAVTIQQAPDYPWMTANPAHMGLDPDFVQFNPEFELLEISDSRTFSSLQLPAGNTDAAEQVWKWVLADPEARAWMNGEPDEWGMKINPVYATSASANSTGVAFGEPAPNSFPKADPYCYKAPPRGVNNSIVPPPLCGTDWLPYKRNYAEAAQVTRIAADGARINENAFAQSAQDVWAREQPQFLGRRGMLALTDTPSAAQFGLQTARLSRAGDNTAGREFVAADVAGITAGVSAMTSADGTTVLQPSPSASAPGAYPLTTLTYAAISPLALDSTARSDYAAFIDYSSGPGQVPGLELGQLPKGYARLPDSLRAEAAAAADLVRTMVPAPTPTPTPTTTTVAPSQEVQPSSPAQPATEPATGGEPAPTVVRRPNSTGAPAATNGSQPPAAIEPPTTELITTEPPTTATATTDQPVEQLGETESPPAPTILTPIADLARSRYAVSGLGVVALGSALGALEITKRPRRKLASGAEGDAELDEIETV